ncbi:ribosomal RNA assembly KRR1, partial [Kipferlia bialata]
CHQDQGFVKRRQRLVGPHGATQKAIELLTGTKLSIQGNTVCAIGPINGIKTVRRVVDDALSNVHPVYHIKELMVKRELAKRPELANEDWDRFLPQFKKRNVKSRKPITKADKKNKKGAAGDSRETKTDKQIKSGEYFLA